MARNYSFIKLDGTLDDVNFYRKDGVNMVKKVGKVSRNRIMNDPSFRRTRENMQEFGGAAKAGKAFRDAFAAMSKLMGDTYVSARISGVMKRINGLSPGIRGERDIDVVSSSTLFEGFNFNKTDAFNTRFFAPSSAPSISAPRDTATWDIPDFETDTFIRPPEGATHCRLVLAAGYVSNYEYDTLEREYKPTDTTVNAKGGFTFSGDIALSGMVGSATNLVVDLTALGTIPADVAFFVGTGIVFYQDINGTLYELAQDNAMRIAASA